MSTVDKYAHKEILNRDEAAEYMGVSESTIKRAIYVGKLKAKRSGENGGGKYLIRKSALHDWFDSLVDA